MSRSRAAQATYVLGSHAEERARLGRQHRIWRQTMLSGWDRAGFGPGQRLLDIGCGPGFASLDLAELVGANGQVLAIDSAPAYLQNLRQECQQRQLVQVIPQLGDLAKDLDSASELDGALGAGSWDGAWCRWVAMFLPRLEPLLDRLAMALRPGGRLVLHEYLQWDTFGLYPKGGQLALFVERCIQHWRQHGGDHPKTQWLLDFLSSYPTQLAAAGRWSAAEQAALESELAWGQQHASLWVTPALVEMVWERL